jgi:hypothetical protein
MTGLSRTLPEDAADDLDHSVQLANLDQFAEAI